MPERMQVEQPGVGGHIRFDFSQGAAFAHITEWQPGRALSYAIDRQAVVDLALYKQGTPADGPLWPYHWAYSNSPVANGADWGVAAWLLAISAGLVAVGAAALQRRDVGV